MSNLLFDSYHALKDSSGYSVRSTLKSQAECMIVRATSNYLLNGPFHEIKYKQLKYMTHQHFKISKVLSSFSLQNLKIDSNISLSLNLSGEIFKWYGGLVIELKLVVKL